MPHPGITQKLHFPVNKLQMPFLLYMCITVVPRKIENIAYAKFWGANKVHYGRCRSVSYKFI